jgi:hypothetical protein
MNMTLFLHTRRLLSPKGGMTLRTRISGLLLGLVLTINAYGQPPSASTSDGSPR